MAALTSALTPSKDWGLFPTVLGLPSYFVFALLAIAAGGTCFFWGARRQRIHPEATATVLLFALLGAGIGAKLPMLVFFFTDYVQNPTALLSGKTMLGGTAGALLGAALAKRLFHIRTEFGDVAAPAAALALAIGRVGCLGAGCCGGKSAPWGVDLGDGVARWPTQLFEIAFHLAAFVVLILLFSRRRACGALLPGYLTVYLLFRYITEFLRAGEPLWAGHTLYQLFCIGGLLALAVWRQRKGGFSS